MGEIYDQLKKAAKEKGLTITAVEKQLGFARGSLSKIDDHKPSAEKAAKLSELLGVPINVLTPAVKQKKIVAVFHKHNSARLRFEEDKFFEKINKYITDEAIKLAVDIFNEEFPKRMEEAIDSMLTDLEWDLLGNYKDADPGTQAAVRKLLDISEEDYDEEGNDISEDEDDEIPVAAHGAEDATPEDLAEDVELVKDDKI